MAKKRRKRVSRLGGEVALPTGPAKENLKASSIMVLGGSCHAALDSRSAYERYLKVNGLSLHNK